MFHPLVKETMLTKMTDLVSDYIIKFPDPEIYDEAGQKVLRTLGKEFLLQSNPTFIYYSHYLTPERDEYLNAFPTIHIKPMNMKRVATKLSKKKQPSKKRLKTKSFERKSTI